MRFLEQLSSIQLPEGDAKDSLNAVLATHVFLLRHDAVRGIRESHVASMDVPFNEGAPVVHWSTTGIVAIAGVVLRLLVGSFLEQTALAKGER